MTWCENPRFHEIPSDESRLELAKNIGQQLLGCYKEDGIAGICDNLGWQLCRNTIAAESTIQSLLVPLLKGDFSIAFNERYVSSSEQMKLWLMGHEIGHSFFYTPGEPPRRIIPGSSSEEIFCDMFADEFTAEFAVSKVEITNLS